MPQTSTKTSEDEEEELLIYLDFKQFLPFEELIDPDTQIKIIGLEGDSPIAQINGRFYQGNYEFATGTKLFFTESQEAQVPEADSDAKIIPFEYVTKTNKVLRMSRVFIASKDNPQRVKPEPESDNTSKYEITTTYEEVLSRFLPPDMEPPRMITEEENGRDLMMRKMQRDVTDDDSMGEEND
ncbi:uncharacterized protein LOC134834925 [Culicoides brevitarsis]|uniref:uncharacterized protein LOC134834925 n=1 Tax=Culicoides brevitarsis TaxID=469753 RepID=UPI00307BDC7C